MPILFLLKITDENLSFYSQYQPFIISLNRFFMPYLLPLESLKCHYEIVTGTMAGQFRFRATSTYINLIMPPDKKSDSQAAMWDAVAPNLILGKIPFQGQDEAIQQFSKNHFPEKEIGAVVSLVQHFEIYNNYIHQPYQWKNKAHYLLPIKDETADIDDENLLAAIHFIRKYIKNDEVVYVHCKAGKGRSAMLVILYLYFYHDDIPDLNNQLDNALTSEKKLENLEFYLKSKRIQVNLNEQQKEKVKSIISQYPTLPTKKTPPLVDQRPAEHTDVNQLFSSLILKNAIIHFTSFKKLTAYAYLYPHRKQFIQTFFYDIYQATNASWYTNLIKNTGPIGDLLKAKSAGSNFYSTSLTLFKEDSNEPEILRRAFVDELHDYFLKTFELNVEAINKLLNLDPVVIKVHLNNVQLFEEYKPQL